MVSDGFFEQDGIYLDDILVQTYQESLVSTQVLNPEDFELTASPNPARGYTWISIGRQTPSLENGQIVVTNALGQQVFVQALANDPQQSFRLNTAYLPGGIYHAALYFDGLLARSRKLIVVD